MDSASHSSFSLGEAASRFLASLPAEERGKAQQEVYKLVRWFGWKRMLTEISIPEIGNYGEQATFSVTEPQQKLEPVKAFLTYIYKEGLAKTNLSVHLRVKKSVSRPAVSPKQRFKEPISLTAQGYAELEAELISLKNERPQVTEEIRKAAADKDFRENAPLEAAREYQGHLEARIRELEATLKSSIVAGKTRADTVRVSIGDTVVLRDLDRGELLHYTLVAPSEANPIKGKISAVSPTGKSLIGHGSGEIIEVAAPAGVLRYQIENIEH